VPARARRAFFNLNVFQSALLIELMHSWKNSKGSTSDVSRRMFLNRCGYIRSGSLDPKSRGSVSRKKISCRDPFLTGMTANWRRGRRAKEGICDAAALDHHFRAPARHVRAARAHANAREHSKHTSRVVSLERRIERFARSASRAPQRTASVHSHDAGRKRRSCASRRSPGARPPSRSGACPRRPRRARVSRSSEARRPSTSPRARRTTNPSPRLRELKRRHICAPASRWRSTCSSTPRRPRTWRMSRRWTRRTVTPRTTRTIPSASTSGTRRADPPERPTPLQARVPGTRLPRVGRTNRRASFRL